MNTKQEMAVVIEGRFGPGNLVFPKADVPWRQGFGDVLLVTLPIGNEHNVLRDYIPTYDEPRYAVCAISIHHITVRRMFLFQKESVNEEFVEFALKCIRRARFQVMGEDDIWLHWHFQSLWHVQMRSNQLIEYEPTIGPLLETLGDPNADPDPVKQSLDRDIVNYIIWSDQTEQVELFWKYVREPDSNFGLWNPVAVLVAFLRYARYETLYKALEDQTNFDLIQKRFSMAQSLLFPSWKEEFTTEIRPNPGMDVEEIPRHWNTHKWEIRYLVALDNYKGSLFWAMNNFANPDAPMDEDTRFNARRNVRYLDYALREETNAYTGKFWRGSSTYNWPETVTDTGKRFTSVTSDLLTAAVFALGRGTSMAIRVEPKDTDGYMPNVSGLQIIDVTVPTPFVRGNMFEKEFVFPQHVKLRFKEFVLVRVLSEDLKKKYGEDPWEDGLLRRHTHFVFLTRVYEFLGLAEISVKRARLEACISCAQPATHTCSKCSKAFFCTDKQCSDHSENHLNSCQ